MENYNNSDNKGNWLYLHWVCINPPTATHLKVGLSKDIEKRKRSYYADGWKDKKLGFLSTRKVSDEDIKRWGSIEVLELALQVYFYQRFSPLMLLEKDKSRTSLEIFPYSEEALTEFINLDFSNFITEVADTVLRIFGDTSKTDFGVTKKLKTLVYEKTKENVIELMLQGMEVNKGYLEEDLYELDALSNMNPPTVYKEIIRCAINTNKLKVVERKYFKI